jgi:hypothetical protein
MPLPIGIGNKVREQLPILVKRHRQTPTLHISNAHVYLGVLLIVYWSVIKLAIFFTQKQ